MANHPKPDGSGRPDKPTYPHVGRLYLLEESRLWPSIGKELPDLTMVSFEDWKNRLYANLAGITMARRVRAHYVSDLR